MSPLLPAGLNLPRHGGRGGYPTEVRTGLYVPSAPRGTCCWEGGIPREPRCRARCFLRWCLRLGVQRLDASVAKCGGRCARPYSWCNVGMSRWYQRGFPRRDGVWLGFVTHRGPGTRRLTTAVCSVEAQSASASRTWHVREETRKDSHDAYGGLQAEELWEGRAHSPKPQKRQVMEEKGPAAADRIINHNPHYTLGPGFR